MRDCNPLIQRCPNEQCERLINRFVNPDHCPACRTDFTEGITA